ncbi:TROVE domain-containing protein [Actinomadura sp. HBU206391]|uniref:TROVE domain-containing protein n=1 Tax=Actinomadura sp. HBU206391 TaxID=2731692 RepID=UPI00164FD978|nr:TROVE domain-containing protein [Actinomadura sp. HBU206391]MBC6456383.1 TROVE domain-containing protein [Actinomadura sp. HBU206391]
MSKFNRAGVGAATSSPVKSEPTPSGRTHEGAPGYARDAKSELYLLAISNMVGEETFYEQARQRDDRYVHLVQRCAIEDPVWTAGLLEWMRSEANMRSAALVGAAEYVRGRLQHGGEQPLPRKHHTVEGGDSLGYSIAANRRVIASVLQRADEPGELLAYWTSKYGRSVPKPIKRGIEDALRRLYTERSLLKYDSAGAGYRFGDVIELTHPSPSSAPQGDLFKHAIDRRHGRDVPIPESLVMLGNRAELMSWPVEERRALFDRTQAAFVLKDAGMTWEAVAGWLQGPMDAKVWESIVPSMGIFALVRNLRNFDEAEVSDEVAAQVAAKLTDRAVIAKSRMLPFRFLSAHRAAPSLRWAWPLEQALNHSLDNVPRLPGRTLVLVDRSPSMWHAQFSKRSTMPWADAAAVFGAAVALRAQDADLVEFGIENAPIRFRRGESVLKVIDRFRRLNGTDIPSAVKAHLRGHDRIVIVTDEQTRPGYLPSNGQGWGGMAPTAIDELIPQSTALYMWNFGGYTHGATPSGSPNRHTFGGLSDAAFGMIPLLERGRDAAWPWEVASGS